MVEKLKKVSVLYTCNCGEECRCGDVIESEVGQFFKVDDVEAILNSLQQLKVEIAAANNRYLAGEWSALDLSDKLRQLLAI